MTIGWSKIKLFCLKQILDGSKQRYLCKVSEQLSTEFIRIIFIHKIHMEIGGRGRIRTCLLKINAWLSCHTKPKSHVTITNFLLVKLQKQSWVLTNNLDNSMLQISVISSFFNSSKYECVNDLICIINCTNRVFYL